MTTKPKPRPSKRQAMRDAVASRAATDGGPEVLGDDAGDTHDGHREPLLDVVEDLLSGADDCTLAARLVVQEAFGGKCDGARELDVLKMVKRDARFEILPAAAAGEPNRIRLRSAAEAAAAAAELPVNIPAADPTAAPEAPTIGDLVAAQAAKPQRITWPHDIGSSVLLLTPGHPNRRAIIRNIADHGGYVLYDLAVGEGTCDGVPADRIGRDLDAEGELEAARVRMAALERHIAKGASLAQRHVEMAAEERRLSEALSKHRKTMADLADELADHARSEPGQTDLRDVVGDGNATPRGERMAAEPSDAEDVLADGAPRAAAPRSMDGLGIDLEQLHAARLDRATASTGKPAKVKPVAIDDTAHALVDVQDGVAVLLPIVDNERWEARYRDRFGTVLALPSDLQPDALSAGGPLCGMPVKVGRKTLWVGPEADAVLVRLPEPEPRAVGKDAAAGG